MREGFEVPGCYIPVNKSALPFAMICTIILSNVELGLLSGPFDLTPDMDIEILFLMAGFNIKSLAISNEVCKMHASIPARICFQDVDDTVIDYGRARGLFG